MQQSFTFHFIAAGKQYSAQFVWVVAVVVVVGVVVVKEVVVGVVIVGYSHAVQTF